MKFEISAQAATIIRSGKSAFRVKQALNRAGIRSPIPKPNTQDTPLWSFSDLEKVAPELRIAARRS